MSGKMMNAYRHKPTSDVAVHEVIPIPEPGQGEVLLKVAAAGLCHSEIHMFEHNTGVKFIDEGTFSFCHEMSGVAVKNGPGSNAKLGQLYVCLGMNPCFECKQCKLGRENMCRKDRLMLGLGMDGGNAEYCVVREAITIPVPEGVTAGAAASATDAIATPYHGLKTLAGLQKGQICVVIGLGGLGLNAVAISVMLGAKTYGIDIKDNSIAAARKLGAEAMTFDELKKLFEKDGLAADVVCDCVGAKQTFQQGQELIEVHGSIIAMGLHHRSLPFDTIVGIAKEHKAMSTFWGTKTELIEILDHIAAGRLKPIYKMEKMSLLPHYIEEMKAGRTEARMAFEPEQYEKEAVY